MKKDVAIAYMVAGISSRFNGKIKQFANIGPENESLIEYSLNQALPAGFTKIVFVVGYKTEKPFKEKFKDSYKGIPVFYALQKYDKKIREKPWGTADALVSAKKHLKCPFIVCNGDDLYGETTFKTLFNHIKNKSKEAASIGYRLIEAIPENSPSNRAIFKINNKGYVKKISEVLGILKSNLKATKTKPDDLCSMNIFALNPEILGQIEKKLINFKEKNKHNKIAECFLPDEISKLIEKEDIPLKIYPSSEKWLGITIPEDEEIVRNILKRV